MGGKIELSQKTKSELAAIANDNISGASLLFHRTLHLFPSIGEQLTGASQKDLTDFLSLFADSIFHLRPCMAPFAQLAQFLRHMSDNEFDLPVIRSAFAALPHSYARRLKKEKEKIVDTALAGLEGYQKIMVHSRSSIVESFLSFWLKQDEDREVWITESRPMCEGTMLAKALSFLPNRKILMVDDARGIAIQHVDAVLVGADTISEKFIINKIGSHAVALLANEHKIPVFVLAELIKFFPEDLALPEEQLHAGSEIDVQLKNVEYFNYYFEKIPLERIHRVISSNGVFDQQEIADIFKKDHWNAFPIERANTG
ncbi:MAG: hypothetical protein H6695_09750 [Deferribacteres bacterium]|nr:hypothetical protein [candidate division KSB1 bacterium]MCB9510456.1 hypothetical protein [Deferribacteres bacterium]